MRREVREIGDHDEWLAWRRQDVTASNIGALFGCHPYVSRNKLIKEMRGETKRGSSWAMQNGIALEGSVAAAISRRFPDWRITKATTYHRLPNHRLGCTPDFWLNDDALIQCKTIGQKKWSECGGKAPLHYTLQTLTELLVTGRDYGFLAIKVNEMPEPHLFRIPRHEAAERRILDAVAEFWREHEPPDLAESLKRSLEMTDAE